VRRLFEIILVVDGDWSPLFVFVADWGFVYFTILVLPVDELSAGVVSTMILILSIVISVSTSFIDWTLLLLFDYLDLTVSKFSLNNGLYVLWSRVRQIMRLRISAPSLLLNIHRLDLSWFLLVQFIANADGNDHSNENNKDNPKNNMSCLSPNGGNRFGVKNLEVHLAFDELADVILVLWRLQNIDVLLVD